MEFFYYPFVDLKPINLGADDDDHIATQIQEAEAKAPEDLTEDDKMVLLGRPKNGDIIRAQLRVKESKEFKVSKIKFHSKCLHCFTCQSLSSFKYSRNAKDKKH